MWVKQNPCSLGSDFSSISSSSEVGSSRWHWWPRVGLWKPHYSGKKWKRASAAFRNSSTRKQRTHIHPSNLKLIPELSQWNQPTAQTIRALHSSILRTPEESNQPKLHSRQKGHQASCHCTNMWNGFPSMFHKGIKASSLHPLLLVCVALMDGCARSKCACWKNGFVITGAAH